MADQKHYSSKKFKQRKRKKKIIKYSIFLIILMVIFFATCFFSGHESLTVNTIEISENKYLDEDLVKEGIENSLNGRYFYLFSKRNFLILPRAEIRESILSDNIFISNIDIELEGLNHLLISVHEHNPVARWCEVDTSDCYLVNAEGLIYIKDIFNEKDKLVTLYGTFPNEENTEVNVIGQYYLETSLFKNIVLLVNKLKEIDFDALRLTTLDEETFEIHFESGPYLLISKFSKPEEVVKNLKTTIETEELNTAQLENLEYIDLRFGNKVYYKIK